MAGALPANRDDPDAPGTGSLNVAVAAGILLHEFTRARPAADASDNRATIAAPLSG